MAPDDGSFLVLGCGSIGRRHMANLASLGVEELIVFDPDPQRAAQAAEEHGARAVASLDEGYALEPAGVLVCSPSSMHLEHARGALERDCHVFVEKPLATTLEGVDEVVDAAQRRGVTLTVGYNLRFNPCLRQVADWLDAGRIGAVASARLHFGSYLPWRHPWEDYRGGYGARSELGGGVIFDAIHELDYALWLFGAPSSAYCVAGTFGDLEIDTEDTAEILLAYDASQVVAIHLDYLQRPHERWCEVIADGGRIRCDLVSRSTAVYDGEAREWSEGGGGGDVNDDYVAELKHFVACVAGDAEPLVHAVDARRSLELALACKRSVATREPVALQGVSG